MRKKKWMILLICLAVLGLCFGKRIRTEIIYLKAESLIESQEYSEAKRWYAKVEDREKMAECDDLILGERYREASELMGSGEYDAANELLADMDGYRDSAHLILECDYLKAGTLIEDEDYFGAIELLRTLRSYKNSETLISESEEQAYQRAEELTYEFKLKEAAEKFRRLGDYKDSGNMYKRCEKLIAMSQDQELQPVLCEENLYRDYPELTVYDCEVGYLIIPKECNRDTRFFIYYPGGRNIEISIDFLGNYIMGAAPNTMALFLHKNGIDDIQQKNAQALEVLEQAAMEMGVVPHRLMLCGSSLGAYPALHSVIYCYEDYGFSVDCAIILDAGNNWDEKEILSERECAVAAQAGTDFYLFEGGGVGMNIPAIKSMVWAGNKVSIVRCKNDEHERISFDALGLGVIDWALGDRAEPFDMDIYKFIPLDKESKYPLK